MTYHNHSLWCTSALLTIAVTVLLGVGVPLSAHAEKISQAGKKVLTENEQRKIKIRMEGEDNLRKQDESSNKQAEVLVNRYKQIARLVASQGGTPEDIDALLGAAAHFGGKME